MKNICINTGETPIFLHGGKITADPLGGPGRAETTYCIGPGKSMDLSLIGLARDPDAGPFVTGASDIRVGMDLAKTITFQCDDRIPRDEIHFYQGTPGFGGRLVCKIEGLK